MTLINRIAAALVITAGISNAAVANDGLSGWVKSPDWLSLSGETRIRYEQLDGQFRAGRNGSDQGVFVRTNLLAKAQFTQLALVGELLDSRHILGVADSGSPLGTSTINPIDLLQAYLEIPNTTWLANGQGSLKVGRFTMELGNERLITRNGTRNTINSFAGLDWQWQGGSDHQWRAFYTSPVQRRFDGKALDNEAKTDQVQSKVRFWGVQFSPRPKAKHRSQWYWLNLKERDDFNQATTNRDFNTLGVRLWSQPQPGGWFYEIESAYQHGQRDLSRDESQRLDHSAYFFHASIGVASEHPSAASLAFNYDYVTGDKNSQDGKSQRFDTLFGARRDDFGPTGIYGPIVRANISAAGVFLMLKPSANTRARILIQGYWLASDDDSLPAARINQPANADRYVANQLAGRWRWTTFENTLTIDITAAYLAAGDVLEANNKGDSRYAYLAATYKF